MLDFTACNYPPQIDNSTFRGKRHFHLPCSHCFWFIMIIYWWLVRVPLVIAFGFLPKILGEGGDLRICILIASNLNVGSVARYPEVVGTLEPYHMLKSLFGLTALKGSGNTKTLGTSTCGQA